MKFTGKTRPLIRTGTMQEIDSETGEVISETKNAGMLLGPPPDKCQECAVDHPWDEPHNQQSMYYQMQFHAKHGRWPTWSDAMAHCTDEKKSLVRRALINVLTEHKMPIPDDLMDPKPVGR